MSRINDEIAGRLEEAARLLRDQGADPYRVTAYLRAATSIRSASPSDCMTSSASKHSPTSKRPRTTAVWKRSPDSALNALPACAIRSPTASGAYG